MNAALKFRRRDAILQKPRNLGPRYLSLLCLLRVLRVLLIW